MTVGRGERLVVELAETVGGIREAQALRYRVFGEELGAKLRGSDRGLDIDEFDDVCAHLIVREVRTGRVVGCTRVLGDHHIRRIGRYYSEREFDLKPLLRLPGRRLEVGRTCIAPDYRQGAAIAVLWSGLARYIARDGCDYLFGCASVPLGENDLQAAAVMNRIRGDSMVEPALRVTPRCPLLAGSVPQAQIDGSPPPLLRAYLRLGAKACGEPSRDVDFAVADILVMLRVAELEAGYFRHFLQRVSSKRQVLGASAGTAL